jgi:hypothetical protein
MTRTQQHHITQTVHDWLTQGMLTPLQGLERVQTLRQEGKRALADVMKAAIKSWHDAEMAHTRRMMARGIEGERPLCGERVILSLTY